MPISSAIYAGGPQVAVNLTGIEPSGTAIGAPRKSSSQPSGAQNAEAPAQHDGPGLQGSAARQSSALEQDGVSITPTASLLARLEQSLAALPAVDQGRAAALRQAIAAGTYRVDADKIAGGLIHSERALDPLPRVEL